MIWITLITGLQDFIKSLGKTKTEMTIVIVILFLVIMVSCDQMFEEPIQVQQCQDRSLGLLSKLEEIF